MDNRYAIEIVNKYVSYLVNEQKLNLYQVYLFGSYAKNKQNNDSDIDVAIVFQNLNDRIDMQLQLMKWRRNFDLSIEPHPFDKLEFNQNNPFAYEILTTGLKLTNDKYA
jgi:predicted nucleotidyltransferase